MNQLIVLFFTFLTFFSCSSQEKTDTNLRINKNINTLFNSIDHIPIVVDNLETVKNIFQNQLHFTVKEGKSHEGIKNCFVKFQDGTYLEFIEPIDSLQTIGKYYTDFLKTRQGGTSMAISFSNTTFIKSELNKRNIPFTADSNSVWQTIEPENFDLFFIEYTNKNWKENVAITTHLNAAISLNSTYFLCNDIDKEAKKYKDLGFVETGKGKYFETSYLLFKVGQSNLYLLDRQNSSKINQLLNSKNIQGICGFEIKVKSLQTFNNQIKQYDNTKYENNKTTIYFKDYNIFMTFTE